MAARTCTPAVTAGGAYVACASLEIGDFGGTMTWLSCEQAHAVAGWAARLRYFVYTCAVTGTAGEQRASAVQRLMLAVPGQDMRIAVVNENGVLDAGHDFQQLEASN